MAHLIIGQLLSMVNFILAVALAILSYRLYHARRGQPNRWLLICFILISLYWAVLYILVFTTQVPMFGTVGLYTRPAITVTFSLMLAEVIIRGE